MQTTKQYIKLGEAYQHYNKKLFTNTLPECLMTLQRGKSSYGYYLSNSYQSRTSKKQIDASYSLHPTRSRHQISS